MAFIIKYILEFDEKKWISTKTALRFIKKHFEDSYITLSNSIDVKNSSINDMY